MQASEVLSKKGYMLRLTLPIFLVQIMQILVNNIDQLMISRWSQTANAAVGNANQISWVLTLFLTVLSTATVILVTQYKGAGDDKRAQVIYSLSLAVNTLISLVIGAVCVLFGRQIFGLMNITDSEVLAYAYQYLAITGGTVLITALSITYNAFFRSNALLRDATIISVAVNLLNILGNWLLIYGVGPFPELGVMGAGISTVFSRLVGLVLLIIVFRLKVGRLDFSLLRPFPWDVFMKLLSIGVPAAGEGFSYDLSQLAIMSFINTMGLVAVNTKIYVYLIVSFAYIFTNSLGEATQVAEGYMLGMRRLDDVDALVRRSLHIGLITTLSLTVLLNIFSRPIMSLFVPESGSIAALREDIFALSRIIFAFELVLEIGRAINLVMVKALQSAGDIKFPVAICIISAWFSSVVLGWFFGVHLGMGLPGIWLGMTLDECVRGIILIFRWRAGGWRRLDIIADSRAPQEEQPSLT